MANNRSDKYEATNRLERNKVIYDDLSTDEVYTNIKATIPISDDIDVDELKKYFEDDEKKVRRQDRNYSRMEIASLDEEKNYDITDVINKAKEKSDNRYKRFYGDDEFLNEIENKRKTEEKDLFDDLIDDDETLKTSRLSKLKTTELSLDLLSELKETENTIADHKIDTRELKNELKKHEETKNDIDTSFFTSSFDFKEDDFELDDVKNVVKKNNTLITVLIVIFIIMVFALALLILIKN